MTEKEKKLWETFLTLPHIYKAKLYYEVEEAVEAYKGHKAWIEKEIESYGGKNAYKDPDVYINMEEYILCMEFPEDMERRLFAVLDEFRNEHIKAQH